MTESDPQPWLRIVRQHSPALVLFARQRSTNPEDIVQEALLRLFEQRTPPDDPIGWLYRVVRNLAINENRSQRRRKNREMQTVISKAWFQDNLETQIDAQDAIDAMERLAVELRETIVLRVWCGRSFAQIADLTSTSAATANRRYHTGLDELRTHFGIDSKSDPVTKTSSFGNASNDERS